MCPGGGAHEAGPVAVAQMANHGVGHGTGVAGGHEAARDTRDDRIAHTHHVPCHGWHFGRGGFKHHRWQTVACTREDHDVGVPQQRGGVVAVPDHLHRGHGAEVGERCAGRIPQVGFADHEQPRIGEFRAHLVPDGSKFGDALALRQPAQVDRYGSVIVVSCRRGGWT